MSQKTLKRQSKALTQIPNDEHLGSGNCKKVMDGLLVAPINVITANAATTAVKVGKGNICRIRTTVASFVMFGASSMTVPAGTEPTSLELNSAGVYLIVATDDYAMLSVNPARFEIIDATTDKYASSNSAANPAFP